MIGKNFYILTGGPGAGKTTTLEALGARGCATVPEAARRVLHEQAAAGGRATHEGDRAAFRDQMLELGLKDYRAAAAFAGPVFFDRGIPELSGFGNAAGAADPPALVRAIRECRYNETVFLFPPWEAIYVHDDLRKHSFAHAIAVHAELAATYPRFGYRVIEPPPAPVEDRVRFLLAKIDAA